MAASQPVCQLIKQPGPIRLERLLLVPEEPGLRPALLPPGSRVAVVGVIGDRHVLGRFPQVGGEPGGVDPLALVVHEVLQMIGVPGFAGASRFFFASGAPRREWPLPAHDQPGDTAKKTY